jgi:hypothetical protein
MPQHLKTPLASMCFKNDSPRREKCRMTLTSDPRDLDLRVSTEQPRLGDEIYRLKQAKKLLDDASMEGMTLRAVPSTDPKI